MKINPDYFKKFKDIHKGQSSIIFGSGKTLNEVDFKKIPKHLINVALNSQIRIPDLKIDYYFNGDAGDYENGLSLASVIEETKVNKNKFIGLDEIDALNWEKALGRLMNDCIYYNTKRKPRVYSDKWKDIVHITPFTKDISSDLIARRSSISFDALQFILYTGVEKIYLVGHDCDYSKGSFDLERTNQTNIIKLSACWEAVKNFIETDYPGVEIINVNPVALKNFFTNITLENLYNS